jgi:predicted NBD/HSP70 family sugar kinase
MPHIGHILVGSSGITVCPRIAKVEHVASSTLDEKRRGNLISMRERKQSTAEDIERVNTHFSDRAKEKARKSVKGNQGEKP